MNLKDIPTARRHVYFYVVLLLATTLLHFTVWKPSVPDSTLAAIKAGEQAAQVQHELVLAEQRFSP